MSFRLLDLRVQFAPVAALQVKPGVVAPVADTNSLKKVDIDVLVLVQQWVGGVSVQLVADAVLSDPSLDGELAQHVLIRELAPAECGVRKVVLAGVDDAYGGRSTTH